MQMFLNSHATLHKDMSQSAEFIKLHLMNVLYTGCWSSRQRVQPVKMDENPDSKSDDQIGMNRGLVDSQIWQ